MDIKIKNKLVSVKQKNIVPFFRHFFIQIFIVVFLIIVFGVFELGRYTVYLSHPNLYTQDRASAVLQNISALIQLPKGTPTMIVINNAASAKKIQPFLVSADNGDILIVYKSAGEAILYRPSANKLVAVGPITKIRTNSGTGTVAAHITTVTNTVHATSTNTKSGK